MKSTWGKFVSSKSEHDRKDLDYHSPQRAVTQKAALLDPFPDILPQRTGTGGRRYPARKDRRTALDQQYPIPPPSPLEHGCNCTACAIDWLKENKNHLILEQILIQKKNLCWFSFIFLLPYRSVPFLLLVNLGPFPEFHELVG